MTRRRRATAAALLGIAVAAGLLVVPLGAAAAAAVSGATPTDGETISVTLPGSISGSGSGSTSGSGSHGGGTHSAGGGSGSGSAGSGSSSGVPAAPVSTKNRLSVSPWRVAPGDRFRVSGRGFQPGESVRFVLYPGPRVLGTSRAGADGRVEFQARTSRHDTDGLYTVQAAGLVSERVASGELAVAASRAPQPAWYGWAIAGCGVGLGVVAILVVVRIGMLGFFTAGAVR